jgi:two-component system, OmpR family, sensor kinase
MSLSLRDRLLVGMTALVGVGLLVAFVATNAAMAKFLTDRVDQQLRDPGYQNLVLRGGGPGPRPDSLQQLPVGTYAALLAADGSVIPGTERVYGVEESNARPVLPKSMPQYPFDSPQIISLRGSGGVTSYHAMVVRLDEPEYFGDYLVIATPLTAVADTLQQLYLIEIVIGFTVLAALVGTALLIIRFSLRPLDRMGATAAAIAAGDLSRRVEPATPKTEIGRLGVALNGMLTQIEAAFRERLHSEQQLRRFVADASHELRTPLTSIRGYAEILRRKNQPVHDAAVARRRIEEEAVRMTALVDDLLLLARLDQGRPLDVAPVNLQAIVRDACTDASAVAPERPVSFQSDGPVVVAGDEMRLRQVVGNLVRNALVHTPAGTPVEAAVSRVNGHAELRVVDHGPGLPAEARERIFEPFYRADPGRSRDRGGTGLGLSIVAAVVAAHKGSTRVEETPGGGATFVVDLPLAAASG